ncbi:probable 2-oxoglutarate-dependent dioxygenase SLC1 [Gastrolobium bilobum]|uniref:probable 2-oxoglutarate-dependent dioxygenase SLC1 n=1 Tax=Gastrolobium bilobum TaxID=150636 RepID=UPI002AB29056|nr:probable 2-oxoglutarate-dependent dioxygenase SLC1 [Gastrolobium bilobum]
MSPAMAMNDQRSDNDIPESQYEKGVKHLYENGDLHRVPKKYILPASDRPTTNIMEDSNVDEKQKLQLPIIDFADLLGPNRSQVLQSLANACEQYGFFQLVNHSISDDVVSSMIDVCGRFFNLSFEERAKYMTTDMKAPVRYGTSFSQTKDSVFCWRDFLKLLCHQDFFPHWPASPVDFRKVAATYAEETKHLFLVIMEAILESLGIREEEDNILKELDNGSQMVVTNFYPPCPQPDLTLGMPPHSDYGFLTLLLQDEVEGLQIQFQDKWVTVQPIPNAFVVNIGDHLEIFSNGKYKSVLHRVLVNEFKSRVSVASLHSLPFNCTVRASQKLVDEANPKRYMDTDFDSFLAYISTRETKKKDFLDSRKLT